MLLRRPLRGMMFKMVKRCENADPPGGDVRADQKRTRPMLYLMGLFLLWKKALVSHFSCWREEGRRIQVILGRFQWRTAKARRTPRLQGFWMTRCCNSMALSREFTEAFWWCWVFLSIPIVAHCDWWHFARSRAALYKAFSMALLYHWVSFP